MGFVGEIRFAAFSVVPSGWAICKGQQMAISDYGQLFSLIGTTYGGDGVKFFNLPDLQGRVPIHATTTLPLGVPGGAESVTLTATQIPQHGHALNATTALATTPNPSGAVPAAAPATLGDVYAQVLNPDAPMASGALGSPTPSSGHTNLQPFTVINFIICIQGIVPEKN